MGKIKKGIGLTFDDVLIEPTISTIESRSTPDLSVNLCDGKVQLKVPVIASCMDTVSGPDMAVAMAKAGAFAILHRYTDIDTQVSWVKTIYPHAAGAAVGISEEEKDRVDRLYSAGCRIFCIDVANGQSAYAEKFMHWLKAIYPDVIAIGGNVATAEGFKHLQDAGADMIRVGIGGGSFCTTRTTTGIGVPQLTSILECAEVAEVALIADGGIRGPADVAKAIGAGADVVMLGGMLVGTDESPGDVIDSPPSPGNMGPTRYKIGRGMASLEAQVSRVDRKSLDPSRIVPEGVEAKVPYVGSTESVLARLMGGLRSAMTYVNAMNLDELRNNATFIQVTNAGLEESKPHIKKISN